MNTVPNRVRVPPIVSDKTGTWRAPVAYALILAVAIGGFLLVREQGAALVAAGAPLHHDGGAPVVTGQVPLFHVLLSLVVIIATARALGFLFERIAQPAVIGEVVAGILLGPSLLGRIAPDVAAYALPASVSPALSVIAQVGVILFMFMVGLELDASVVRQRARATIAISHASITLPFLLGSVMALWLYPRLATSDVPFTSFALFIGVSMSITAFPVLARILTDRGLAGTRLGVLAITCAAVDDVTAWCLLAFIVSIVHAQAGGGLVTLALAAGFVVAMIVVGRPVLARLVARRDRESELGAGTVAFVLFALLLSALATEAIGIHALFGAFLVGALVPHDTALARDLRERLHDLVVVLFLPVYFAFTGTRTQIGLVHTSSEWLICGGIVAIACIGKFGGAFVAARLTGSDNREATALGVLMNTRGLVELVVLNLGLDLGILSPTLFTMLVVMAVVTTALTSPLLALLRY